MVLNFKWISDECPQRAFADLNHIYLQVFRIRSLWKLSVSMRLITFSPLLIKNKFALAI